MPARTLASIPFIPSIRRSVLRLLPLTLLLAAAPTVYASTVTYDVSFSPTYGMYGGTGTISVSSAPAVSGITTYSAANGQLQGLSFTLGNQTFTLAGDPSASVEFLDGKLYNISFAQTIGSSPNRFTLDTSGVYAFYYNNGFSESDGNISASLAASSSNTTPPENTTPASPTPEPGSLLLLATALLGGGFFVFRRKRAAQS